MTNELKDLFHKHHLSEAIILGEVENEDEFYEKHPLFKPFIAEIKKIQDEINYIEKFNDLDGNWVSYSLNEDLTLYLYIRVLFKDGKLDYEVELEENFELGNEEIKNGISKFSNFIFEDILNEFKIIKEQFKTFNNLVV